MSTFELRRPEEAREYLLVGFCLARTGPPTSQRLRETLAWALEITSNGNPLPLPGFITDVGQFANRFASLDVLQDSAPDIESHSENNTSILSKIDTGLARRYEDYVLGKLYADLSIERAVDALQKFQGLDRVRAVAYLITQIAQRSQLDGAIISPAVIKGLLAAQSDQLSQELLHAYRTEIPPGMLQQLEQLIGSVRSVGELLGAEDVFELERGIALTPFGQRIALRQLLQAVEYLSVSLPKQKPRGAGRQYSVATNIFQEDFFPVGGFTSISNRGTLESLLRSELAYIDDHERPDLFDVKFVRDELLYYSRDENQFLRRRVCFIFVLDASLEMARVKDTGFFWQRIIYILATIVVAVRSLIDWLNADALRFEIIIPEDSEGHPLANEQSLMETIFQDEIQNGTVSILRLKEEEAIARCQHNARQFLCHLTFLIACPYSRFHRILVSPDLQNSLAAGAIPLISVLEAEDPYPTVQYDDETRDFEGDIDAWRSALKFLMEAWL